MPLDAANSHVELFSVTLYEKEITPLSLNELKEEMDSDYVLKLVSAKINMVCLTNFPNFLLNSSSSGMSDMNFLWSLELL